MRADDGKVLSVVASAPDLVHVALGVSLSRLAKIRTMSTRADFGLTESIGTARIDYVGERESSKPVNMNAQVRSVRLSWEFPSNDSAKVEWRKHMDSTSLRPLLEGGAPCQGEALTRPPS